MTVLDPVVLFLLTSDRKKVTLDEVVAGVELERKPVLRVLDKLTREGYLEEVEDNKLPKGYADPGPYVQNPTFAVIGDLTERATKRPISKNTGRDKIWRAIKQLKLGFTRSDLVRLTGSTRAAVDDYTKMLQRDGIIKVVGKSGHQHRYNLSSAELKRPAVKEKVGASRRALAGGKRMQDGWIEILRQRAGLVGRTEVARELGVSAATISLLLSGKYPASTSPMEARVMKMYGRGGKIVCPVQGEIDPGKCAELWNKAKKLGVKGSNASMIKQRKACLKCDLRNA
ncbi:MAG: helix-turn-helix transcriptional regulator [Desulfobulbus sp.]|nr:helix-turn-helix transcriptional regulator [Desulfobulbus sp.]